MKVQCAWCMRDCVNGQYAWTWNGKAELLHHHYIEEELLILGHSHNDHLCICPFHAPLYKEVNHFHHFPFRKVFKLPFFPLKLLPNV